MNAVLVCKTVVPRPQASCLTSDDALCVGGADAHNLHLISCPHNALLHAPGHHCSAALQAGKGVGEKEWKGRVSRGGGRAARGS